MNLAVYSVGKKADCLETMKVAYLAEMTVEMKALTLVVWLVASLVGKMVSHLAGCLVALWVDLLVYPSVDGLAAVMAALKE